MGVGVGGRGKGKVRGRGRGVFGGPLLVRVGRHAFGWLVGLGFVGWGWEACVDGWMDGYFLLSSTFSFSATSQSLCQSYEISQRRAYRTARSCKGRYSRRTHTTHACIHTYKKKEPPTHKQTNTPIRQKPRIPLLTTPLPSRCLFVCLCAALLYSTLTHHCDTH